VLPYLNAAQGEHPALGESIERLRRLGSGSCSAPMSCRCIDHARASATSSPGTSPSPPIMEAAEHQLRRLPGQPQ
jgi:hypothetical protein